MLSWIGVIRSGWAGLVALAMLAGCGGPVPTRPVIAPTVPVAITAAPGDVWWPLDADLGMVAIQDGALQPGETVYLLVGIQSGLSPSSPNASSRQVVFNLTCEAEAGHDLHWWLEPDPGQTAGCGDSLTWTLSYTANRVRLGLALSSAEAGLLAYTLTATLHSPY